VGFVKRALWDVAKAGLAGLGGPVGETAENVYATSQYVGYARKTVSVADVNDRAARCAGNVEDAVFAGKVVGVCRKLHQSKRAGRTKRK
jgi:hypothetical protein